MLLKRKNILTEVVSKEFTFVPVSISQDKVQINAFKGHETIIHYAVIHLKIIGNVAYEVSISKSIDVTTLETKTVEVPKEDYDTLCNDFFILSAIEDFIEYEKKLVQERRD